MDIGSIISSVLNSINGMNPVVHIVLVVLGTLMSVATIYVKLTPATNKVTAAIIKIESIPVVGQIVQALMFFSIIDRKSDSPPSA